MFEPSYSKTDLARRTAEVAAEADLHPVIITKHNKRVAALLSVEDYKELVARARSIHPHAVDSRYDLDGL